MSDLDARRELIACYAVGALDEAEMAEVERLVDPDSPDFDPALRDELRIHLEMLATLAPEVAPPEGLRDRIFADLPARESTADTTATVIPFERRASRRRPQWFVPVAVGAAAAVIALVIGVGLMRDDDPSDLREVAVAAMDDPDAQVVDLTAAGGGPTVARAAMYPDGQGFLVVDELPELGADQAYQLWMLPSDDAPPVSLGLVDADADGATAFRMAPGASGVAVSREPASGSVSPTEVVAAGTVA